jgi:hypothetical protein
MWREASENTAGTPCSAANCAQARSSGKADGKQGFLTIR